MARVTPVVEGHGDRDAARTLIHRVVAEFCPEAPVDVARPVRVPKTRLLRPGELERVVALAAGSLGDDAGGVLVLIDGDDDCPRDLGPELLARVRTAHPNLSAEVVVAEREFEAWGLAAARSLRGWRGLPDNLEPPADPQAVRGAKEWLTGRMPTTSAYSPTADQASLANALDLHEARTASSFDKFCRAVCALVAPAA